MNEGQFARGAVLGGLNRQAIMEEQISQKRAAEVMNQADGQKNSCGTPPVRVQPPVIVRQVAIEADADFCSILNALKHSQGDRNPTRAVRAGWNAPGQWIAAQFPDINSKMGAPYLYLCNAQGVKVPWVPSQGDLFARDWAILHWNDAAPV